MPPSLLALVPAFPLLGAILIGLLNRKASRQTAGGIATAMVAVSAVLSFMTLFGVMGAEGGRLETTLWTWMAIGNLSVDIKFVADALSATMMCVITGIGTLIHLYSIGYMDDPKDAQSTWRFFAYLNLFVFSMLLLVMGSNFLLMFVGWEGVGLCSYLLIGFWFENTDYAAAGKKAFVTNRVGDFSFILGLFWLYWALGDQATVEFSELQTVLAAHPELVGGVGGLAVTAICLLFFGGATGKSAQIPLFVWLPDAMAGPTPVSALIHAATMVTSGIYMICRLNFLFAMAPLAMGVVATIGAATALFAATIAISQNDIKKVLAYSTVSQLGYMFLGVGTGAFVAGFFHVMTHAFFKALLFLGSGAIIHALHHEQDMRKMGGLRKYMPITFGVFVIAWLAIIGIPPFSGFISKDEILWLTWITPSAQLGVDFPLPKLLWAMGALTAVLTAFYMSRLMFMTFWGEYRGGHGHDDHGHGHDDHGHGGHGHGDHKPHEVSAILWGPLAVLALLSAFGGLLNTPHWFPKIVDNAKLEHFMEPIFASSNAFFKSTYGYMQLEGAHGAEHGGEHAVAAVASHLPNAAHEMPLMAAVLFLIVGAVAVAAWLYVIRPSDTKELVAEIPAVVVEGSQNKWYIDELYELVIIKPTVFFSKHILWSIVDVGIIDGLVNASASAAQRVGDWYGRSVQNGQTQVYALAIAGGGALLVVGFVLSAMGS